MQIFTNGKIYTVHGEGWENRPSEAFVCDETGIILYVGTSAGARDFAREHAEDSIRETDLAGQTVLPGFIDSHVHLPGAALTQLYEIYLYDVRGKDAVLDRIREFVTAHPELDAYFGAGFMISIGDDARGPRREWLDEICADKPIIIESTDGHSTWMNSKALEYCGIYPETAVPAGAHIPVDPDTGELWGVVVDASALISCEPSYTEEQCYRALLRFQDNMLHWGYTAAMFIPPNFVNANFLLRAEQNGELVMKGNIGVEADPDADLNEMLALAARLSEEFSNSERIKTGTVKFFADGVVEGRTAYLLEPYAPGAKMPKSFRGTPYWDDKSLTDAFAAVTECGLQIHVHCIGDAACTQVIDALEAAGVTEISRPVLTHLQLVDPDDLPRMAKLGVIAAVQPFWHFKEPNWHAEIDFSILGEQRADNAYPSASAVRAGIRLTFSGDYPVSPVNNPFWAIESAVTRNLNNPAHYDVPEITDADDPSWLRNPAERISLARAIEAYTINGAYQLSREDRIGSLAVGKQADFIVIDSDIFATDPVKIDETRILAVFADGKKVV